MEHTGPRSLELMIEWVSDLRTRGLIEPRYTLTGWVAEGTETIGRLRVGTGADALITEGGHLVFRPDPRGGLGTLEVVDAERFFQEFQPLR